MKNHYTCSPKELFESYHSKPDGLSESDAKKRLEEVGKNRLKEGKTKSILQVFLEQFADLLVVILIVAAVISMLTGNIESTVVILAVITLNAILGTIQYVKAEKSLNSLKEMSSPTARVIRDGKQIELPSEEVVPGDILLLEAGNMVAADGSILENHSLQVNESALTGEAESVNKTADTLTGDNIALGDRINMVFSGSLVTYGRATVLVTETGMQTEIGKIATLMNATAERKTPLQVSLDGFSKKLSVMILIVCAVVFGLCLYRKMPMLDSMLFAVALAVAAIPEALSSIVTISLAIGTSKMAKQNAIIKNLRAVEGLGCVSVICSDKTGTLTQNRMTVRQSYMPCNTNEKLLHFCSVLCNDSSCSEDGKLLGDPTETALYAYYKETYGDPEQTRKEYPRLAELPFDSDRKLMSTLHHLNGHPVMVTKGALDVLLNRTSYILRQGKQNPITKEDIKEIISVNNKMSEQGLRVLAFATRTVTDQSLEHSMEKDFCFIGLIAMMDPPREESMQAVHDCIGAGIRPVMITGDHVTTASSIARQIGIFKDGDLAVTGPELDKMSDKELDENIEKISVYARVSPEHKIRIVSHWQEKGHIVAMTGDGVNDAPALKKADIGIAMGITGTEVSKDAASMILTDDNFATIIKAVEGGRNIYANIKNAIKFLLSGNAAGILTVLFCSLFGLPVPFSAVQLLFINLLTDSLPALAIGMEPPSGDLLKEKPRRSDESLLTKDFLGEVIIQGFLIGIATIVAYYVGLSTSDITASTMAFATICLARLWHGFNSRGKSSIFRLGVFKNKYSIGAFIIGALLLGMVLFVKPLHSWFNVVALNGIQIGIMLLCSVVPTVLIQLYRVIRDKIKHR